MPFPKQNKKITNQSTSKKVTKTNPKTSKQVLRSFFFFFKCNYKTNLFELRVSQTLESTALEECRMALNLQLFFVMFLSYSDTYKGKKIKNINLFSWFWLEPGPQPGCPENIPYLSLEMQQTRAGPVYGVDATGVPRTHSPEPCPASRHQTADTR